MNLLARAWIWLLRLLSFGWWERERVRVRAEEARIAERRVERMRSEWIALGVERGKFESERDRGLSDATGV